MLGAKSQMAGSLRADNKGLSSNPLRVSEPEVYELNKQKSQTNSGAEKVEYYLSKKNFLLKRISPFLMLAAFLCVFFPYILITGKGPIHSEWVGLLLFAFSLVNVVFIDFALWNYFRGKKIFRIWVIELTLSFLIIHLLV